MSCFSLCHMEALSSHLLSEGGRSGLPPSHLNMGPTCSLFPFPPSPFFMFWGAFPFFFLHCSSYLRYRQYFIHAPLFSLAFANNLGSCTVLLSVLTSRCTFGGSFGRQSSRISVQGCYLPNLLLVPDLMIQVDCFMRFTFLFIGDTVYV